MGPLKCCTASLVLILASLFFAVESNAKLYYRDICIIEYMTETSILLRGEKGLYELIPMEVCLWCQEGMEVLLKFRGILRATLEPSEPLSEPFPLGKKIIGVFIIREGGPESEE